MAISDNDARIRIEQGVEFPYHDRPPVDAYERAALGVLADLGDRRGIKHGFDDIDEEVRIEIVESLARIIRVALAPESTR